MVFFKALSLLPLSLLYVLSDFLYILLYYIVRYRRRVVLENLQKSFPDKSAGERLLLTKAFYKNLTDTFVETLKVLSLSEAGMRHRVALVNTDFLKTYVSQGKVVLVMSSHSCNWEWGGLATRLIGPGVDPVYKPLSSPFFDRVMNKIRSHYGSEPVSMQGLLRNIVRRRSQPRLIGLVADQAAELPVTAYWTTFLNQETDFFVGAEKIARSYQYPVAYAAIKRLRRGHYQMTYSLLAEPPYEDLPPMAITEKYVRTLEADIRENPADWLWSHNRWKHKRDD
ncbi:MAG: lysophospholipid acyltransferase family protein [Cytophagaceae bacterium]|nr:lysophospholipid acyltransferase family protein [Cytophagaceae bacterium]